MALVSPRDSRSRRQRYTPYQDFHIPEWGEVLDASVGTVIDEGLSVSGMLNREGWAERQEQARQLVSDGAIKREDYTTYHGRSPIFDYARLAKDFPDQIKTDEQLREERNALLAQRRKYAQSTFEHGAGSAQFLGTLVGYAADPVNLVTMGVGTGVSAAKSLGIVGRALLASRNAAAVNLATEMVIQPFVYQHKLDIESPYAATDVVEALGSAALIGGAFGAVGGGLTGFFKRAADAAKLEADRLKASQAKAEDLRKALIESGETVPPLRPQERVAEGSDFSLLELNTSINYLQRAMDTLKLAPKPDLKKVRADFISNTKASLVDASDLKMSRGETKAFNADFANAKVALRSVIKAIPDELTPRFNEIALPKRVEDFKAFKQKLADTFDTKLKKPKKLKGESTDEFKLRQLQELDEFKRNIRDINRTLKNEQLVRRFELENAARDWDAIRPRINRAIDNQQAMITAELAKKTLADLDAGTVPAHLQRQLDELIAEAEIAAETKFLHQLEANRAVLNRPSRLPEQFVIKTSEPAVPSKTAGTLQDWALEDSGLKAEYNKAMQQLSEIEDPKVIIDGEVVNAKTFMDSIDEELDGLESIMVCRNG